MAKTAQTGQKSQVSEQPRDGVAETAFESAQLVEDQPAQAPTRGRRVDYTDHTGRTHTADVALVSDDGSLMLWVMHCDDNPHPPYRVAGIGYDAGGAPGTWAWPPRS